MDFLLILILIAVIAALWTQLRKLGASHAMLEDRLAALESCIGQPSDASATLPATTRPPDENDAGQDVPWPEFSDAPPTDSPAPSEDTLSDTIAKDIAGQTPPATTQEQVEEPADKGFDFEELFGRRLPIWAGGITLAIGGIFLVRLAIESGLMTPPVRVATSFVFGILLLGAAELAHRFEARLADPRVRQALAGAGLATLYAAFYLAGSVYELIGPGVAFGGLALVTAIALALAFRFGLPTALLGLVGGFATPAMVSSDNPNLPLLTFYLALLAAGIAYTGQRMGAAWLGLVALLGGFGWGAFVLSALPVDTGDFLASGLYLVVLGTAIPAIAVRGSQSASWSYTAAAAMASIQLAVLLMVDQFSLLAWGIYLLLLLALAVLGWREPSIRRGGGFAAAVGVLLLAIASQPLRDFTLIAVGLALLAAVVPIALARFGQAREEDRWQAILVPPALAAIAIWQMGAEPILALGLVPLGGLAVGAAIIFDKGASHERFAWGHGVAIASIAFSCFGVLAPYTVIGWLLAILASAILLGLPKWYHTVLALLGIAVAWALPTLVTWTYVVMPSLSGIPTPATELPALASVGNRLVPVALLAALASWRLAADRRELRIVCGAIALVLAVVSAHVLFRQLFPLLQPDDFAAHGLIERTLWQGLLLGAGYGLLTVANRRSLAWARWAGGALVAVSLAHFAWFGLLLHNPLWDAQAVGSVPVANLLLPSYVIGAIAAWLAGREIERTRPGWGRVTGDIVLMTLALLFALSSLRQAFAGSVLATAPMGATEDLLRSLLGIVVALAFLGWGWWRKQRRWRVGSLVLMLLAVAKVFLVDAAGLDGLLRVASFLALGFSLIGIGWIYSRLLRSA